MVYQCTYVEKIMCEHILNLHYRSLIVLSHSRKSPSNCHIQTGPMLDLWCGILFNVTTYLSKMNAWVPNLFTYVRLHVTKFGIINTIKSICFCHHNMALILGNRKIGAFFNHRILDQFKIHVQLVQNVHNQRQTDEKIKKRIKPSNKISSEKNYFIVIFSYMFLHLQQLS